MPSFGSNSPSLKKMEYNTRGKSGAKFNFGNIAGDPFSLATIGIAFSGWMIAFISSIIADVRESYPNYSWWTLVYMLFCIVGVFLAVATDTVYTYHVAIVGFLGAGLVFTTSSVNSLIYNSDTAKEAAAAGFILLSMVSIVWMIYYGSQPDAVHRQTIDSFALHKDRASARNSRHMTQSYRPETAQQPQMYNSAQLTGFETSTPVANGYHTGLQSRESAAQFPPANQAPLQHQQPYQPATSALVPPTTSASSQPPPDSGLAQPSEYPYRAKAIYSYEANPDDANEISFTKHEILEVSDVSGRWWQAKKENGDTGIAPSNYLILL